MTVAVHVRLRRRGRARRRTPVYDVFAALFLIGALSLLGIAIGLKLSL